MADNEIVIDLSGDVELAGILNALPQRVLDNVAKTSFRGPAKRIVEAARALAPVSFKGSHGNTKGFLRKNIKVRTMRKKEGRVGVIAGTSPKGFGGPAYYGYFQEYGYKIGKRPFRSHVSKAKRADTIKELSGIVNRLENFNASVLSKGGQARRLRELKQQRARLADLQVAEKNDKRREIPGKFFIRRAFDANKNISQQEMTTEIKNAVEVEVAKEAKRQAKKAAKQ